MDCGKDKELRLQEINLSTSGLRSGQISLSNLDPEMQQTKNVLEPFPRVGRSKTNVSSMDMIELESLASPLPWWEVAACRPEARAGRSASKTTKSIDVKRCERVYLLDVKRFKEVYLPDSKHLMIHRTLI